jgi:hypothetical protein
VGQQRGVPWGSLYECVRQPEPRLPPPPPPPHTHTHTHTPTHRDTHTTARDCTAAVASVHSHCSCASVRLRHSSMETCACVTLDVQGTGVALTQPSLLVQRAWQRERESELRIVRNSQTHTRARMVCSPLRSLLPSTPSTCPVVHVPSCGSRIKLMGSEGPAALTAIPGEGRGGGGLRWYLSSAV